MPRRFSMRLLAVAAIAVLAIVGMLAVSPVRHAVAQRRVPTNDAKHPRLRFPDSLTSMNDRCIVSQSALNPRVRPVYVNGRPVGFC